MFKETNQENDKYQLIAPFHTIPSLLCVITKELVEMVNMRGILYDSRSNLRIEHLKLYTDGKQIIDDLLYMLNIQTASEAFKAEIIKEEQKGKPEPLEELPWKVLEEIYAKSMKEIKDNILSGNKKRKK